MSTVETRELREKQIPADEASVWVHQIVQPETEPHPTPSAGVVRTYYFREVFAKVAYLTFAGRPVVTRYDPKQWRHSHEEEYEKDWNEAPG